jgi:hypothetical protein
MQGAWMGCFQGYGGGSMQDLGYELPKIPILRTSVNRRRLLILQAPALAVYLGAAVRGASRSCRIF